MIARSSVEVDYKVMALVIKFIWIKHLMTELGYTLKKSMKFYRDNQATIYIASNLVLHKKTKHLGIDCHFIKESTI